MLLGVAGCAGAPTYTRPMAPAMAKALPGVHHRVEAGQTLWRISKIYNIDLDEIVRVNRISDATKIEVGQLIFIPYRQKPQKYPTSQATTASSEDFIWPIRGEVIASFGQTFNTMLNKGLNIRPYQHNDVVASRSGKVVFYSDNFENFGKTLIIDHGDGFSTVYARNTQVFVRVGDTVDRGTTIAKAGSSARDKSVYLHFEIRKGYIPQNPYFYLPR